MGYYWRTYQYLTEDFFEWLFAGKEKRKMLRYVPKGCRHCDILGECRDEKNNWKCRNGCQFIRERPY